MADYDLYLENKLAQWQRCATCRKDECQCEKHNPKDEPEYYEDR